MLTDSRYWIASGALAVLLAGTLLWSPKQQRLGARIIISTSASFACISLIYVSRTLISRMFPNASGQGTAGSSDSTTTALALFSIVATLCTGYAFVIVGRFERQRKLLDERVEHAEKSAEELTHTSGALKKSLDIAEEALGLSNKRLRAFFQIHRAIRETDPDESAEAFQTYLDLRLLESLVCRTDWNLVCFDLEELMVVLATDHRRLSRICDGPILDFVASIPASTVAITPELSESQATAIVELVGRFVGQIQLSSL
jgi:hypothetical protein